MSLVEVLELVRLIALLNLRYIICAAEVDPASLLFCIGSGSVKGVFYKLRMV